MSPASVKVAAKTNRGMLMPKLIVFLLLAVFQSFAFANQDVTAKVHYAGLFTVDEQFFEFKSVKRTTEIPAVVGQVFGIFLSIEHEKGNEIVKIQQVIKSPTTETTESLYFNDGAADFLAFGFDSIEEVVEGEWAFELWHDGEQLASQKFTVSTNFEVPSAQHDGEVASVCERKKRTNNIRRVKVCVPPKP